VSTITEEAPILNWIYVDNFTYEVKYGVRIDAQPHFHGPFDCTRQDRRLTFEGWEGFCAVEETSGLWAIYFDRDDNGLQCKYPKGKRVLEVELTRVEKRWKRDPAARRQEQSTMHAENDIERDSLDKPEGSDNVDGQRADQPEDIALPSSPVSDTQSPSSVDQQTYRQHAGSTPSYERKATGERKQSGAAQDLTERFQSLLVRETEPHVASTRAVSEPKTSEPPSPGLLMSDIPSKQQYRNPSRPPQSPRGKHRKERLPSDLASFPNAFTERERPSSSGRRSLRHRGHLPDLKEKPQNHLDLDTAGEARVETQSVSPASHSRPLSQTFSLPPKAPRASKVTRKSPMVSNTVEKNDMPGLTRNSISKD